MSDATDVHHCYSGIDREEHFLDDNTWKAVCRNCHNIIHNVLSAEEAAELKLKITKNE
jgi:predicted HNH restriction endonuclease